MFIDSRNLEESSIIEGDICIVGAGAAGISMALEWINTPYDVIVLEGGGFDYNEKVQHMYDGKTTGQNYFPLKSSRLHSYGGTTWMWAGMSTPFDDIDFMKRDWVSDSGWPMTKQNLDPYYIRAQKKLKLGPYRYDLEYWKSKFPDMNPFPLDETLIYHKLWQHSEVKFGDEYYSTLNNAENIYLFTYAKAVNIKAIESIAKIKEMLVKNHSGKTLRVHAKYFILACSAIQNARLLLASNTQSPNGLGNDNDIVGRYFMEHIEMVTSELKLSRPYSTNLYTVHHGITKVHTELAITKNEQQRHGILNGTASLLPLSIGRHRKPRIETWKDKNPLKALETNANHMKESYLKAWNEIRDETIDRFQLITRMEQAPNPISRITLSKEKDSLGMPRASLHWEFTELEKVSLRKLNQLIGQEMENSKLGKVELMDFLKVEEDLSFPNTTTPGWHHMGGTRINENPKKGVLNSDCQVHGISNLFVAGSSCFPTSGAANPTLTLLALTIRLSDHIKKII